MIFVAGPIGARREGNCVGKGDMRAQIQQVGENIKACLEAAGATLADIVKTNTYVTDYEEFSKHGDMRMRYFGPATPTSTTVEIRRLADPDFDDRDRSDRLRRQLTAGFAFHPDPRPATGARVGEGQSRPVPFLGQRRPAP